MATEIDRRRKFSNVSCFVLTSFIWLCGWCQKKQTHHK